MIDIIIEQLKSLLTSNQFLSGGLVLGILTGIVVYFKSIPRRLWNLFIRNYVVKLEIANSDDSFNWMIKWFDSKTFYKKTNLLKMVTKLNDDDDDDNFQKYKMPNIYLSPGIGLHIFWYKNRPFWLFRERPDNQNVKSYDLREIEYIEIHTLKIFKNMLMEFIQETRQKYYEDSDKSINMYIPDCNSWKFRCKLRERSIDTVFLDNDTISHIITDIEEFKDKKDFYYNRGIPYRRGYLLYGAPGTGKTTTIIALASYFKVDIFYLSLTSFDVSDSKISEVLNKATKGSFIVIEDIDTISAAKRDKEKTGNTLIPQVSFAQLLNALDGIGSQEGRIIFMTTNHKEKLDEALIRPGRIDYQIYFGYATNSQKLQMFKKYFPEATNKEERDFLETYENKDKMTTADLQEIFLKNKNVNAIIDYGRNAK